MKKLFTIYSEEDGKNSPNALYIEFYQEEIKLLSGAIRPKNTKDNDTYVINAEKTEIGLADDDGIISILEDNFMECELTFLMKLKQDKNTYFKISNYGVLCKFRYDYMSTKTLISNQDLGKFDVFYDETTNTITVPSLNIVEKNE